MIVDEHLATGRLGATFPLDPDRPFTLKMAVAAGTTRWGVRNLERSGLVRRLVHGVYVGAHVVETVGLRARALALVVPVDCVVVDRHAGWLHGADMILAPGEHIEPRPISVFRPAGHGRLRSTAARSGERRLRPDDVMVVDGLLVTTRIRTAWDLGRVRWPSEALPGVDAMFRLGDLDHADYLRGVSRFARQRWVTTLRAVAPLADGRSESPPESVLRLRCFECAHLPAMTPQLEVSRPDGTIVARVDLGNRERRIALEYDGVEWHSDAVQVAHDRERRDLLRELGWQVLVFTAADLFGHHTTVEDRLSTLADSLRRS